VNNYILVIDDDPTLATILEHTFKDFQIVSAHTLLEARQKLELYSYSAMFVDIELPDGDGLTLLQEIIPQDFFHSIPVFILSSHANLDNKVTAFSLGVDDFITKPFSPLEVQARLNAKLKKLKKIGQQQLEVGNTILDFERRIVLLQDNGTNSNLHFTPHEFDMLALMAKAKSKTHSREEILNRVWGETTVSARGIDSHIARIRTKLTNTNIKINAIKGSGYCLSVE
jgi:DNA-binding response OmpR family regulator